VIGTRRTPRAKSAPAITRRLVRLLCMPLILTNIGPPQSAEVAKRLTDSESPTVLHFVLSLSDTTRSYSSAQL
jgi:hypothetical protein